MADQPFYTPGKKPERLWEFLADHVVWTCDLWFHGESNEWEAMILRDGELAISQRFAVKAVAAQWAELEKADIEEGWQR